MGLGVEEPPGHPVCPLTSRRIFDRTEDFQNDHELLAVDREKAFHAFENRDPWPVSVYVPQHVPDYEAAGVAESTIITCRTEGLAREATNDHVGGWRFLQKVVARDVHEIHGLGKIRQEELPRRLLFFDPYNKEESAAGQWRHQRRPMIRPKTGTQRGHSDNIE